MSSVPASYTFFTSASLGWRNAQHVLKHSWKSTQRFKCPTNAPLSLMFAVPVIASWVHLRYRSSGWSVTSTTSLFSPFLTLTLLLENSKKKATIPYSIYVFRVELFPTEIRVQLIQTRTKHTRNTLKSIHKLQLWPPVFYQWACGLEKKKQD